MWNELAGDTLRNETGGSFLAERSARVLAEPGLVLEAPRLGEEEAEEESTTGHAPGP